MLTAAVSTYLARRRALGSQLRDTERILNNYALFAEDKGDVYIRTPTVLEWIRGNRASPLTKRIRLRTVVLFARYHKKSNEPAETPWPNNYIR